MHKFTYRKAWLFITVFGFIAIAFAACSTKKNTFTRRAYHNLTAHYNAYYNGNESLKEGIQKLKFSHKDDYSQILPVYKLGTAKDAEAVFPEMDRAFEKASKVIKRHSMYIRNVEYNKWIDDAYMLIGKSHFYKQDYRLAIATFDFVLRQYDLSELVNEAKLYQVLAHSQMKKYTKSADILRQLEQLPVKTEHTKFYKQNLDLANADLQLKQEEYEKAIPFLQKGIKANKKKEIRSRLSFILGQVYQKLNKLEEATELYAYVIKKRPEYEMEFNATLNMANCYDASTGDSEAIKKQLNKMAKDVKNVDFLDQIYFVMGEIELKEKDTTGAIEYFRKSAQASVSNNKQKAVSYLKIAELYFTMLNYEDAQAFYDSTMAFLPKDYPDYKDIESKKNVLGDLVLNINVIRDQDSLQRIANMTDAERDKFLDELIAQLKKEEEERRKKERELQEQMALMGGGVQVNQFNTKNEGKWYFYNPALLGQGFTEFKRKWGNRKLEDNWRLTNKEAIEEFADGEMGLDGEEEDGAMKSGVIEDKEYYLKSVPLTDSMMEISNISIQDAYYNLGVIYNEGLSNLDKSTNSFETLITRYPETEHLLKTYYQLYRIYLDEGNTSKAEYYKNIIINDYPESDYAKIILDPEYNKILEKKRNAAEILYASTYDFFLQEDYPKVYENAELADSLYAKSPAMPKFAYLKALSLGKEDRFDEFIASLEHIVKSYTESEVKPIAEHTLGLYSDRLSNDSTYQIGDTVVPEPKKQYPYNYNEKAIHFYVCVVNIMDMDMNKLKIAFSDYNQKYFSQTKLTISNVFLDDKRQIITISNFKGKERAMVYYNAVVDELEIFKDADLSGFDQFIISTENYPKFYRDKNVDLYDEFFNEYYFNEEEVE